MWGVETFKLSEKKRCVNPHADSSDGPAEHGQVLRKTMVWQPVPPSSSRHGLLVTHVCSTEFPLLFSVPLLRARI